jgi:predicted SprT family Zn-dependent metalloprotease
MIIPTSFKIRRKRWIVAQYPYHACEAGRTFAAQQVIHINRVVRGRPRTERQLADAFWHEMTHAILFDMKHRLAFDEKFVEAFSKRLSEAVHTAQLP